MYSIIIVMILMIAIPVVVAAIFSFLQAIRRSAAGDVLDAHLVVEPGCDDQVELELWVLPRARSVVVERIVVDREFGARVLAQTPRGFRERHPAPPPDYAVFEPDLGDMSTSTYADRQRLEEEKRRQHSDLVHAWADLCESVMTWEGRMSVPRGKHHRITIPMRTDVAASGRFTLIYSYRTGIIRSTATVSVQYRPRLVAVSG